MIFGEDNVKKEWSVTKDSQDGYARGLYAPRLDIAVGPFNIDGRIEENNAAIIRTLDDNKDIIECLIKSEEYSIRPFRELRSNINKNPRCFLAIEIEKSGSRKHMLGNIVNASIIGAIGIVVPFDDKALAAYKRINEYITFAAEVKKTRSVFKNVLIIKNQAFIRCLKDKHSSTKS